MFNISEEKRAIATLSDIEKIKGLVALASQASKPWQVWAKVTAAFFDTELDERVWVFAQALMAIANNCPSRAKTIWYSKQGQANLFEFKVVLE